MNPKLYWFVMGLLLGGILAMSLGCASVMSKAQEDISKQLLEYTQCPTPPVFEAPLLETPESVTMKTTDFNKLDKYVINLEICSAKRLLDIVERNRIIQKLLKQ